MVRPPVEEDEEPRPLLELDELLDDPDFPEEEDEEELPELEPDEEDDEPRPEPELEPDPELEEPDDEDEPPLLEDDDPPPLLPDPPPPRRFHKSMKASGIEDAAPAYASRSWCCGWATSGLGIAVAEAVASNNATAASRTKSIFMVVECIRQADWEIFFLS